MSKAVVHHAPPAHDRVLVAAEARGRPAGPLRGDFMRPNHGPLVAALLALQVAGAGAATQTITPISSLHQLTSNGIPLLASPPQLITIQGTVTSPDGIFSTTSTDIYVQDATGGVDVFASST